MKRAWCEKCRCPLTLLLVGRHQYEKRRLCARCEAREAERPGLRLVAKTPPQTVGVLTEDLGTRFKAALRRIEDGET